MTATSLDLCLLWAMNAKNCAAALTTSSGILFKQLTVVIFKQIVDSENPHPQWALHFTNSISFAVRSVKGLKPSFWTFTNLTPLAQHAFSAIIQQVRDGFELNLTQNILDRFPSIFQVMCIFVQHEHQCTIWLQKTKHKNVTACNAIPYWNQITW